MLNADVLSLEEWRQRSRRDVRPTLREIANLLRADAARIREELASRRQAAS